MSKFLLFLIWLYRKYISPYLPPRCRFYPSCSQYASEAISECGWLYGCIYTLRRIIRCHPFSPGGYDPFRKIN